MDKDNSTTEELDLKKPKWVSCKDVLDQLRAPFPNKAYGVDKSRGLKNVFTSINNQYIVERLCEVFGPLNWRIDGDFLEREKGVLFLGYLLIDRGNMAPQKIKAVGWCDWNTRKYNKEKKTYESTAKQTGDVYKSAKTDALSKAASQVLIGNDVFKGLVKPDDLTKFIVPFGDSKGKHFDEIEHGDLGKMLAWCQQKNEGGKFNKLIGELTEYMGKK